jgi:hypothetical protein
MNTGNNPFGAIGMGPGGSELAIQFCREATRLKAGKQLLGIGIYLNNAQGQKLKRKLEQQLRRLSTTHFSIKEKEVADVIHGGLVEDVDGYFLRELANNLMAANNRLHDSPIDTIFIFTDETSILGFVEPLKELKDLETNTSFVLVCATESRTHDAGFLSNLEALTTDPLTGHRVVDTIIFVDTFSPLFKHVGPAKRNPLVCSALAGMALAPQYHDLNRAFKQIVPQLHAYPFSALAIDTIGVKADGLPLINWFLRLFGVINVSSNQLQKRIVEAMNGLLPGSGAQNSGMAGQERSTAMVQPALDRRPLFVNCIVPFRKRGRRFKQLANHLNRILVNAPYEMTSPTVVQGKAVDITEFQTPDKLGETYCQVAILYGFTKDQLVRGSLPRMKAADGEQWHFTSPYGLDEPPVYPAEM